MANTIPKIATRVSADGATIYMTRAALKELVVELTRLIAADPAECFEVHMNMHFSTWEGDELMEPTVTISEELRPIIVDARQTKLEKDIASGEIPKGSRNAPFEVTLMHVSPEAVAVESAREE